MVNKLTSKVLLLGNEAVGKTSILMRQNGEGFSESVKSTIGASYSQTTVRVNDDSVVVMQVWDTAGQERFRSLVTMYYRNADAALLVFDVCNRLSFTDLKRWIAELENHAEDSTILVVVGNKIDHASRREVSPQVAKEYANRIGASYIETSAATDEGISDLFRDLAHEIVDRKLAAADVFKARLVNGAERSGLDSVRLSTDDLSNKEAPKKWKCKC